MSFGWNESVTIASMRLLESILVSNCTSTQRTVIAFTVHSDSVDS